jgi:tryptophanyl-tRNA synthetase
VGEDQASHVELTREAARRFNHLYGREINAEEKIQTSLAKLSKDSIKRFEKSRKAYQETGDAKAMEGALGFIASAPELDVPDRERLLLEQAARVIEHLLARQRDRQHAILHAV